MVTCLQLDQVFINNLEVLHLRHVSVAGLPSFQEHRGSIIVRLQ